MRIAIVSAYSETYQALAELSYRNKKQYADLHGYSFHYDSFNAEQYQLTTGKHPSWFKILSILTRLPNHDWIWWSDADTIFANPKIRLEDIINTQYDIIAGEFPLLSKSYSTLHTGNFLIRCSPFSKTILSALYNDTLFSQFNMSPMREEDALLHLISISTPVSSKVLLTDISHFSSWVPMKDVEWNRDWRTYTPGDFILHFPTPAPLSTRIEYMRKYIALTRNAWK